MTSSFMRTALVLGLLTAIGPFAIDMYLPALPAIGQSLHADTGEVQWSLMAFFLSLGLCQLIYGPWSDMVGRKTPLYVGLVLFALTSMACGLAQDIHTLTIWRFIQGIGACATMAIPRAIVRDLHTGADAARLMSLLMLVFSVSPVLAPLAGSIAIELASWRAVFWAVTVAAVLGLVLTATMLPETRPPADRIGSNLSSAWAGYVTLMKDRHFLGLTFIGGFGMASFFVYLANSSFVLIQGYGLTPTVYSFFFSINAVAFIGTAQLTGWLTKRFGLPGVVKVAAIGYVLPLIVLVVVFAMGVQRLDVLAILLFIGYGFLGLIIPTTSVLALDNHGDIAGTASALLGTLQMVTGAVIVALMGLFMDGSALAMVGGITACALVTWLITWLTLRHSAQHQHGHTAA